MVMCILYTLIILTDTERKIATAGSRKIAHFTFKFAMFPKKLHRENKYADNKAHYKYYDKPFE